MIISAFTLPELERFERLGNLTDDETELLWLRADGWPLEYCAEELNVSISTVKRISQRLCSKIQRIMSE